MWSKSFRPAWANGRGLRASARREVSELDRLDAVAGFSLGQAGSDAIVTSPGVLRQNEGWLSGRGAPGIVLCLDWTNQFRGPDDLGFEEGRSTLVASVDDALRLGADAVMTYLFLGSDHAAVESRETERNVRISRRCEELGIVRIIETMARSSPNLKSSRGWFAGDGANHDRW